MKKNFIVNFIGRILIYTFIFIMIVAYIGGIYGIIHAIQTKDKGVKVEATISKVTKHTSSGKYGKETIYRAYVDYSYQGKKYNEHYPYYSPSNDEGDVIIITINSEKPKDILNFKKQLGMSIGIVSCLTLFLVLWIKQVIRNKELKKNGIDIKNRRAVLEYYKEKNSKNKARGKDSV